MDWVSGIQNAIDYIEDNITENLDYEVIASHAYVSSYHFQRTFSILCGYSIGEYIRNRRLTLAGNELSSTKAKVIDVALNYGYDSPDSFAKAFFRFHGISPSAARDSGVNLKSFGRLSIKISLEGGNVMNYKIEEKEAFTLIGYKRRFTGDVSERFLQEKDFWVNTRKEQDDIVKFRNTEENIWYDVNTNFSDDGYDHYIAVESEKPAPCGYDKIEIPKAIYVVCKTEQTKYPTLLHSDLRKKIVSEWLPSSGYELANSPEIAKVYWFQNPSSEKRYIELWLPIINRNCNKIK